MNRTLEDMMNQAEPVIRRIVRRKLGPADVDREDCIQQARLDLVEKFRRVVDGIDAAIENPADYAARVAYNVVHDGFRARDNTRSRLKNRLRRFLSRQPAYGLWPDSGGVLVGGYAGWERSGHPRATGPAARLRSDPAVLSATAFPRNHWERMGRAEWNTLLQGVFDHLDGPLELDGLVDLVGTLLGVEWAGPDTSLDSDDDDGLVRDVVDARPTPADELDTREEIRLLWDCIGELPREWMLPLLLNPPSVRKDLRGELAVFVVQGVAGVEEIGDRLALTSDQYRVLYKELDLGDVSVGWPFGPLWESLPLPDTLVGKLLDKTAMQVIGLRKLAMKRLARCRSKKIDTAGHMGPVRPSA